MLFRYIVATVLVFGAVAHCHLTPLTNSWYPRRCCGGNDCFLADAVRRFPYGALELSTGTIVLRIAHSFPIEVSPDGKPHFCVWLSEYGYEARCVISSNRALTLDPIASGWL